MAEPVRYDSKGTPLDQNADPEAEKRQQEAKTRQKVTGFSAGRAGADTGGGGEPMPKQADYADAAAFGAALRAWREKRGRAKAVKEKMGASSAP